MRLAGVSLVDVHTWDGPSMVAIFTVFGFSGSRCADVASLGN
jgi:hypothetical protein